MLCDPVRYQMLQATTSLATALLIGHQLSFALVAVDCTGTAWQAEDPKYAFHAAVIIASLVAKNRHKPRRGLVSVPPWARTPNSGSSPTSYARSA